MSKQSYLPIDYFYNSKKVKICIHKDYEFTKKFSYILLEPKFSFKAVKSVVHDLTYKKMNDWETNKLITLSRKKNRGWRQFSRIDIIKLLIISDLKKFGFQSNKIRAILDKISQDSFFSWHIKSGKEQTHRFLELEYFTFECISGIKNYLYISKSESHYFLPGKDVISFFILKEDYIPLLVLPFFKYISKIFPNPKILESGNKELLDLYKSQLTDRENSILDILRNDNYEEIKIKKAAGGKIILNTKTRKSGNFTENEVLNALRSNDFQSVTVVKDKGKAVSLIQDQRFKA